MKEALLKKRYGIPAALLLVLLVVVFSGAAVAWYTFSNIDSATKVNEPLSTTETKEFSDTMDPGKTNTWSFDIENSADVKYLVRANLTFTAPDGVSITSFMVGKKDKTDDLLDGNSTDFSIGKGQTISCSMTISAAKDAAPGEVSASFDLNRA